MPRAVSRVGVCLCLLVFPLILSSRLAAAPPQGKNLGPEDESKQISLTIWLNLHNKAALDALVEQMYDKSSANYHQFLTMAQFADRFAPTAKEAAAVRDFLTEHNLKVTSTDKYNLFVTAQGSVADAQAAFHVQINRVMVEGKVHRLNASEPAISEPAGTLISAVQGLNDFSYRPHVSLAINADTGEPYGTFPLAAVGPDGLLFSAECLRPPQAVTFTTNGGTPLATYFGNRYGADITNTQPGTLPPCGYASGELQQAYGLNPLYNHGLDGTGQTIMIVDGFGSGSLVSDANLFSSLNGLPALTSTNFAIFTPVGPATCPLNTHGLAACANWNIETTLDVEWAHSIAPGASIALVLSPDNSFTNLDLANTFAIENTLGNVLSNSFGIPEIALVDFLPSELVVENGISEIAAALGISHQVSTGDSGDNLALNNAAFGINSVSAGANADSPFVTAVGGTSTFLDSHHNIKLQTGWGLNETQIADKTPNPPTIPPLQLGFVFGAGGGPSFVYAKPKFQRRLPGKFRQTPDIAMDADPQTGVEIVIALDENPAHAGFTVVGGTSLSCPMFSALWAIANQASGGGPIGEAAPLLYELPPDAIIDVNLTPRDTSLNVTGVIVNPPSPPAFVSADFLSTPGNEGCSTTLNAQGMEVPITCPAANTTRFFVSALRQSASTTRWHVFTFGADSSLATGPGWDDVTGLGTPNGGAFISAVVDALSHH